jgi:2-C-methyl-D-erythritol 4-phosphate cytidylyltransferase
VHDGVRPFVTPEEISRTVSAAARTRAAILVAPVTDTIKAVKVGLAKHTFRRTELRRALTPQCFRYQLLRQTFASINWKGSTEDFTDESMLVERKVRVAVVEGNSRNIKITQPEDIALAEIILKRNPEFRIKKSGI